MSDFAFQAVEQGLRYARDRAAYLAADVANAGSRGFQPMDLAVEGGRDGAPFTAVLRDVAQTNRGGMLEYAMAATAKTAVVHRALADQEHAMLREFRTVAEQART